MTSRNRVRSGFTLVELLIVVVIIGIIAAIAVPRFSSASNAAQAKSTASTLKIVNDAMELYKADILGELGRGTEAKALRIKAATPTTPHIQGMTRADFEEGYAVFMPAM